jgi:hypothetical protein
MKTKRMSWLAVALLAGLPGLALLQAAADVNPASQRSADEWLALVDAGKYEDSWNRAHSLFKAQVTKEQWVAGATDLVSRLGALKSRKLKEAVATRSLPGAPDGDYTVFTYDSSYENLPAATDKLVTATDKDGTWRVTGYFVQPAGQ